MSEQSTGSTGRWLKRITQSMSGEPRDLPELIEDLREASERGLFDGDALVMLEGVCWRRIYCACGRRARRHSRFANTCAQ
jgi:Mg2+/Co2+ transporter CorC